MPLEIVTIPCLSDNYAYLVHDPVSRKTALVDIPEARPILTALTERDWKLDEIWITHHHDDHVQGLPAILKRHEKAVVRGATADAHRLPPLDLTLSDGDSFDFAGHRVDALDVSGHTIGHIAYSIPSAKAVFSADSLMALGCGRLFEGSADQMWTSLGKFAALLHDTKIYSGHEYTETNANFALTIEPDNPDLISRYEDIKNKRHAGQPTVPSTLAEELATNPFLRAGNPGIRKRLNMKSASASEVFAEIRARKDAF